MIEINDRIVDFMDENNNSSHGLARITDSTINETWTSYLFPIQTE